MNRPAFDPNSAPPSSWDGQSPTWRDIFGHHRLCVSFVERRLTPVTGPTGSYVAALGGLALQGAGAATLPAQRAIADYLLSRQHKNGGWSHGNGAAPTNANDTSACIQVLEELDRSRYELPITQAQEYLLSLQRPDGGYPTYERGGESEVTATASVVVAQSRWVRRGQGMFAALRSASRFLIRRQDLDGRFERGWSSAETYSIFRVLWALDRAEHLVRDLPLEIPRIRALGYLLEAQRHDGGWGHERVSASDALSTAYGLSALCLLRRHLPIDDIRIEVAVRYLISQQDTTTGEISSVPDIRGSRPIPFNATLLSTIYSSLALAFAADTLAARASAA
jgi:hypothetical protein